MELTQLIQFKAVADYNSISLAAKQLHISQPALSTMLRKLESELGVALFDRTRNKITLNEAGTITLGHVNKILQQADNMKSDLHDYVLRSSHIRLGFCDPGPMWYCVPHLSVIGTPIYYDCYSQAAHEEVLLLNNSYDIIISSEKLEHPELASRLFILEKIYLSVSPSHPLSAEKELSLKDPRITSIFRFIVNGAFIERQQPFWESVKGHIHLTTTNDYFLFCQTIKDPSIITSTTKIVRHYRNDGPDRILIPISDPEMEISYHISYLKNKERNLKNVIDLLDRCAEAV